MHQKRKSYDATRHSVDSQKTLQIINHTHATQQLTVNINVGTQRSPITLYVPKHCNMKILKSMLWFHLKKILTLAEYNAIAGFETTPAFYQRDYQLEAGIGTLEENINLSCFLKDQQFEPDSLLCYKLCKLISIGGFSKVYLLRNKRTGQFMTGKFILKQTANLELVMNEHRIASDLDNPFIVKTHHFIETEHFYVIVMEFLPGGELFELLKANKKMKETEAQFYIVETLLALEHLHSQDIIYRDIKPENIILDQHGHIKLTDFGLAKRVTQKSYSFCGSLDYMAPEVIDDNGYSLEVDYYSVGNLLFQLLMGSPPFYHPKFTTEQTKFHIKNTPIRFNQKMNLTPAVMSLLSALLNKEPSKRLGHEGGISQILQHEWFSNIDLQAYNAKIIDPPHQPIIRMTTDIDESVERLNLWEGLIQKDIKILKIRHNCSNRKRTQLVRQSLDSQKDNNLYKFSEPASPTANSKVKTNMSLLYSLTHKRSTSEKPRKNDYKFHINKGITSSLSVIRSLNVSRKGSLHGPSRNFDSSAGPSHIDNAKSNVGLLCGPKNKENSGVMRKKRKESRNFVGFKK